MSGPSINCETLWIVLEEYLASFYCLITHQKQLGEERIYLSYRSQFIMRGNTGRKYGPSRNAAYCLDFHGLLS